MKELVITVRYGDCVTGAQHEIEKSAMVISRDGPKTGGDVHVMQMDAERVALKLVRQICDEIEANLPPKGE